MLQCVAVFCSVLQSVATCSEMVLDAEFVAIDRLFIVNKLNIKLPFNGIWSLRIEYSDGI